MPFFTLSTLVPWVMAHGYLIFYIIAVIEGTMITIAAGVASALGYFNIWIIILLAIAGDLTSDTLFYFIGYNSRKYIIEKHKHFFGLTSERIQKFENLIDKHFKKTMAIVKLSPIIPIPGLITIGASRVSLKKYVQVSLLITAPKCLFFAFLGFYSTKTYMYLTNIVKEGTYIAGGLMLLFLIIYIFYQKIMINISKKLH